MSATTIRPDITQAQPWYELLFDNGEELEPTEWRVIPRQGAVVGMAGTFDEVVDRLIAYNLKGYGIYAVINRIKSDALEAIRAGKPIHIDEDGKKRWLTSDDDIIGIRAVWAEIDRAEAKPGDNLRRIEEGSATPSILLRSSEPHKLHSYFGIDDGMDNADFTRVQLALAGYYGGDTTVSNPSRIMRVPGFFNTKPKRREDWKLAQLPSKKHPKHPLKAKKPHQNSKKSRVFHGWKHPANTRQTPMKHPQKPHKAKPLAYPGSSSASSQQRAATPYPKAW